MGLLLKSLIPWIHRLRRLLGIWWIAVGIFHLVAKIKGVPTPAGSFGFVFPTFFGVLALLPEIIRFVGRPVLRFIDNIYYPAATERPPLNYRLADTYLSRGETDLALEGYMDILHFYPRELPAYLAAISILLEDEEDEIEAKKLFRKGMRRIRKQAHREALQTAFLRMVPSQSKYAFVPVLGVFDVPVPKNPGSRWEDTKSAFKEWVRRMT